MHAPTKRERNVFLFLFTTSTQNAWETFHWRRFIVVCCFFGWPLHYHSIRTVCERIVNFLFISLTVDYYYILILRYVLIGGEEEERKTLIPSQFTISTKSVSLECTNVIRQLYDTLNSCPKVALCLSPSSHLRRRHSDDNDKFSMNRVCVCVLRFVVFIFSLFVFFFFFFRVYYKALAKPHKHRECAYRVYHMLLSAYMIHLASVFLLDTFEFP